jgi:putative ABC transport system permease protein
MIRSYFVTAFRFLLKNKTFSFINIIVLYVTDQYSYDAYHQDAKNIYRITTTLGLSGNLTKLSSSSPPIAPAMKHDFAEIKQFTRVIPTSKFGVRQHLLKYQEKSFYEKDAVYVDSTFFDVFTYHFTYGHAPGALTEPYSVVLLKPVADKLFGKADPLGKTITIDNAYGKHDFKVNGVVDESLGKSHLHASLFITMNSGGMGDYARTDDRWAGDNFAYAYVKLEPTANAALLEKKFPAFLNKYAQDQLKSSGMEKSLQLQPLVSIHTTTKFENELGKTVSPSFLNILLLIAGMIQLIACINFMNLSTARASKRAKEVGVRKVIGAARGDLVKQFLGESFLLSLTGVLIAIPLLLLSFPWLNQITGAAIQTSFLSDYRIWLMLLMLILVTGLLAGGYPAFYLSAFQAIRVIKGNFTSQISAAGLRQWLVVFQFVLSIVLISGIIVVYSQLNFVKNKDLGFDKNQKLIFSFYTDETKNKMAAFADELRNLADVKAVSLASNYPSQFIINDEGFTRTPNSGNLTNAQDVTFLVTDEFIVKALGIKMLSGRDFRSNDSGRVLINEKLATNLGINPADAIGTRLYEGSEGHVEIVGVMKDFNFNSLRENVKPFMFRYGPHGLAGWGISLSNLVVNTSSNNYKALLAKIEILWKSNYPFTPFEYAFLDDEVQKQYESEIILSRIINSFTLMAILISCLGLFGLAAFSAEQRTKEIGVRKVLGANVIALTSMLSKDFLKLVLVAIVIATPISWWALHKWLQAFAYQVDIAWWMFGLAGLIAILIALITVSFQTIRAAIANPVRSLRAE